MSKTENIKLYELNIFVFLNIFSGEWNEKKINKRKSTHLVMIYRIKWETFASNGL